MQQGQGSPGSKPPGRTRSRSPRSESPGRSRSAYEPPGSSRFYKSGSPFDGHRPSTSSGTRTTCSSGYKSGPFHEPSPRSWSPRSGSQQEPSKSRQRSPSYSPPKTLKSLSSKVPGVDFSRFWKDQKSKDRRKLRPEHERFLDTSRFDDIPAKFNPSNSNHGQAKNKHYCSKCDVETSSRSLMQAHKEGAKHKRMCAQVQHFRCDLCHIEVPCRDTLDNHMRGKDHIKRATQLDEERLKKGDVLAGEGSIGYRLGPSEMAKLAPTEKEELESLRKTVRTLKAIVKDQNQKLAKFKASVG